MSKEKIPWVPTKYVETMLPQIVKEKGGTVESDYFKYGYLKQAPKIVIKCAVGHMWNANAYNIVSVGSWCSDCYRKTYTIKDLQSHAESMDGKCLTTEYTNSTNKYTWQCGQCSNIWDASWASLIYMHSWCPNCNNSCREVVVKMACEEYTGYKFDKSHSIIGEGIEVDLFCSELDLLIEVDGIQHHQYVPYYHSSPEAFHAQQQRDNNKNRLAEAKDMILDRIPNKEDVSLTALRGYIHNYLKYVVCVDEPEEELVSDHEFFKKVAVIRTRKCSKYTEFATKIIDNREGKLHDDPCCLSRKYKFEVECKNGHTFDTTYDSLERGRWCLKCAHNAPVSESSAELAVIARNYTFISAVNKRKGSNKSSCKYITVKCPNPNHPQFEMPWDSFKKGCGCTHCGRSKTASSRRKSTSSIIKELNSYGLSLIGEYKNLSTVTVFKCSEGHTFTVTTKSVRNIKHNGNNHCPACIMNNYVDIDLLSPFGPADTLDGTILKFKCTRCDKEFDSTFVGMQRRRTYICGKGCH